MLARGKGSCNSNQARRIGQYESRILGNLVNIVISNDWIYFPCSASINVAYYMLGNDDLAFQNGNGIKVM